MTIHKALLGTEQEITQVEHQNTYVVLTCTSNNQEDVSNFYSTNLTKFFDSISRKELNVHETCTVHQGTLRYSSLFFNTKKDKLDGGGTLSERALETSISKVFINFGKNDLIRFNIIISGLISTLIGVIFAIPYIRKRIYYKTKTETLVTEPKDNRGLHHELGHLSKDVNAHWQYIRYICHIYNITTTQCIYYSMANLYMHIIINLYIVIFQIVKSSAHGLIIFSGEILKDKNQLEDNNSSPEKKSSPLKNELVQHLIKEYSRTPIHLFKITMNNGDPDQQQHTSTKLVNEDSQEGESDSADDEDFRPEDYSEDSEEFNL